MATREYHEPTILEQPAIRPTEFIGVENCRRKRKVENPMDLDGIKKGVAVNVYHIDASKDVPLHKHKKHDEVFYCIKGEGVGVLEESGTPLTPGEAFIVPAGTLHTLSTESELYVASFLVPVVE